jgi:adenylate cyclase
MATGSLIMEVDYRRIEAEVERQSVSWEIGVYRVLAALIAVAVLMILVLTPWIGSALTLPLIAYTTCIVCYFALGAMLLQRWFSTLPIARWVSASVEASFGTIALAIILHVKGAAWAATSPVMLIYPLAITASTMRLRPMLVLYVAAVASVEYVLLYRLWLAPGLNAGVIESVPTLAAWAMWERAFWMMLTGTVAAFATVKIKQATLQARTQAYQRRQLASELSHFVSKDVAEEVLSGRVGLGQGERRRVTVLFCDLRDFTALCEREQPEVVLKLLNSFYERACRMVQAHGGHVNKFLGDGLLAIFGAPDEHVRHARAAAECALQLQVAAEELRAAGGIWSRLRLGVGLDTGDVVMGALGSPERHEYTAIGATVNRAARLQALSAAGDRRIVLSDRCAKECKGMAGLVPLGEVIIKGVAEPTMIYTFRR